MLAGLGALGGLAGAASGLKNPTDQYVAFLKTRSVQDALIDRFKLTERYDKKFKQDTRQALETKVLIAGGKDGLITIDVEDREPQFAANLANAYVEELGELLNRLAITEAQQRRAFFEKQLGNAKDQLVKAEQALKAGGVSADTLKVNPQAAVEGLARLQAAITAQQVKLASMRGYLADSAPDFRQAQIELAALRSQLAQAEKPALAPTGSDGDYIAKFRNFKYQETLFELFAKQYEIARIDESREGAVIQVVDVAQPPERKSKPKKAMIAVLTSLVTGFALLLGVFVRHAWRNARQDPESAEKLARLRAAFAKSVGRVLTPTPP